jgi:hypothetical protein
MTLGSVLRFSGTVTLQPQRGCGFDIRTARECVERRHITGLCRLPKSLPTSSTSSYVRLENLRTVPMKLQVFGRNSRLALSKDRRHYWAPEEHMRKTAILRNTRSEADLQRRRDYAMALGIVLVLGSLLLLCVFAFVNGE